MGSSLYQEFMAFEAGAPLPLEFFPHDVLQDDPEIFRKGDHYESDAPQGRKNVSATSLLINDSVHRSAHKQNLLSKASLEGRPALRFERFDVRDVETTWSEMHVPDCFSDDPGY